MGEWKGKPDFVMTAVPDRLVNAVPGRPPDEYVAIQMGDTAGDTISVGAWFNEGSDGSTLIGVQIMDAYIPANALSHMVGWDTIQEIEDEYHQQMLSYMGE